MACAARSYGDQMSCVACSLVWDRGDPNPPECGRKGEGKEPKLTKAEIEALQFGENRWFNRLRRRSRKGSERGYFGQGVTLPFKLVRGLVGLGLFFETAQGGVRTSYSGSRWLDNHLKRPKP